MSLKPTAAFGATILACRSSARGEHPLFSYSRCNSTTCSPMQLAEAATQPTLPRMDWLTDWLIYTVTEWLVDLYSDWMIGLIYRLIDCLPGCLFHCMIDWLTTYPSASQVGRSRHCHTTPGSPDRVSRPPFGWLWISGKGYRDTAYSHSWDSVQQKWINFYSTASYPASWLTVLCWPVSRSFY